MGKDILLTKSDEEIIRAIQEQAYRHQMNYRGCCQIQVKALTDHLGIFSQEVFRAATPFAAGVARKGEQCGHLTGAIMVIGLFIGRSDVRDAGQPQEFGESPYSKSQDLAGELFDKFKEFWGTTKCFDIQEMLVGKRLDVTKPDVQKMVESGEYFDVLSKVCCNVAASASKMAAEILLREIRKEQAWYRFDQKPDYDYKAPKK
jgi:C_GCAxxG_C_C family probable redox protein